jgi:hypothetical protein
MTLSKVWIQRNHPIEFPERALVIASPEQHATERHVTQRLLIVQFKRASRPSFRLRQRLC